MLMVTTTVWMLNRVHTDTSDLWPHLSLWLEFVELFSGLQHWLLVSATAGNSSEHGSGVASNGLSVARWQLDSGLLAALGL